jgi:hypothetical protein
VRFFFLGFGRTLDLQRSLTSRFPVGIVFGVFFLTEAKAHAPCGDQTKRGTKQTNTNKPAGKGEESGELRKKREKETEQTRAVPVKRRHFSRTVLYVPVFL